MNEALLFLMILCGSLLIVDIIYIIFWLINDKDKEE